MYSMTAHFLKGRVTNITQNSPGLIISPNLSSCQLVRKVTTLMNSFSHPLNGETKTPDDCVNHGETNVGEEPSVERDLSRHNVPPHLHISKSWYLEKTCSKVLEPRSGNEDRVLKSCTRVNERKYGGFRTVGGYKLPLPRGTLVSNSLEYGLE